MLLAATMSSGEAVAQRSGSSPSLFQGFAYEETLSEQTDYAYEDSVEKAVNAPILHDYQGKKLPAMREQNTASFASIASSLDDQGVAFSRGNENVVYVLSDDLRHDRLGLFVEGTGVSKSPSQDTIYVDAPRYTYSDPGREAAQTVLHEQVHNRVAELSDDRQQSLYDCIKGVGDAQYAGSAWVYQSFSVGWSTGMVSPYASRNIHEDIAETATTLLAGDPEALRERFDAAQPWFAYVGEGAWHDGIGVMRSKHTCFSLHGLYEKGEGRVAAETLDSLEAVRHE
jgi:hypothetical protein